MFYTKYHFRYIASIFICRGNIFFSCWIRSVHLCSQQKIAQSTKGFVKLGDKCFANYNIVAQVLKLLGGFWDFTPILLIVYTSKRILGNCLTSCIQTVESFCRAKFLSMDSSLITNFKCLKVYFLLLSLSFNLLISHLKNHPIYHYFQQIWQQHNFYSRKRIFIFIIEQYLSLNRLAVDSSDHVTASFCTMNRSTA